MFIDILQSVVNYSESVHQLKCTQINKHVYENIFICHLVALKYMDQYTIEQQKFFLFKYLLVDTHV